MFIKKLLTLCLCSALLFACGCTDGEDTESSEDSTGNSVSAEASAEESAIDNAYSKLLEVKENGKSGVEIVHHDTLIQPEASFTKDYFIKLAADTKALYDKYDFVTLCFPDDVSIKVNDYTEYGEVRAYTGDFDITLIYDETKTEEARFSFSYGIPSRTVNENRVVKDNKLTLYKSNEETAQLIASEICFLRAAFASDFFKNASDVETYNFSGVYGFMQKIVFKDKDGKKTVLEYSTHGIARINAEGDDEDITLIDQ